MGADAMYAVEYKSGEDWYRLAVFDAPRDYRFFGLLAGVRGPDEPVICEPRGWPDDADEWPEDPLRHYMFAAGWLTLQELQQVLCEYHHGLPALGAGSVNSLVLESIHALMEQLDSEVDVRFLFGFDQG